MNRFYTLILILVFTSLQSVASNITSNGRDFRMPSNITPVDFAAGKVIMKLLPEHRDAVIGRTINEKSLRSVAEVIPGLQVKRKFPGHDEPALSRDAYGRKLSDLSLIYEVTFDPLFSVEKACNLILRSGTVQYAEPLYIPQLLYNPNDPDTASQYYLGLIRAYDAWDISKGDTNIVVGVTDTGTDLDHPDLVNGIKYNYADPVNGLDDDGDGYIDNFNGWDLGDGDNDPSVDIVHGSFVCGFAGAATDNATGMAGPGFNVKFLPVKISSGGILNAAYEGIVYAADHGCQIINCSWGGFGGGQYGQDVIDYATINQNRLVIGAAGNSNNENPFYPASYNYVFSVTGTNDMDDKWVNSSYGAFVDICAPGEDVYSTIFDDTYSFSSGTSFAAPIVAAGAGLVMSHLPSLTPLQVAEQLRATANDNIYSNPGNANYEFKLGKGRLDLYRALTETPKSVRYSQILITDNNDNAFAEGDTLDITGIFTNYLAPLTNLSVSLTADNPNITVLNGSLNPGAMTTLSTFSHVSNPFRVIIGAGIPFNTRITLKLDYTDGTYSDWQIFDLVVNVDYINLLVNDIGVTITSRGRIGYNEGSQNQGIGFTYNSGDSHLYDASLVIGVDTAHVSDRAFGDPASTINDDFVSITNVRDVIPTVFSDRDLDSRFDDSGAGSTSNSLQVNQRTFAWSTPTDSKYVIVEYTVKNNGSAQLQNLYTGLYSDWDLGNAVDNRADYDATRKMGYIFSLGSSTDYVAIKQLSPGPNNYYALENNGSAGSVGIYNGFTEAEKYLTQSTQRLQAGQGSGGGDVSMMISSGPHTINSQDSIRVAFALIAGDDLNSVNQSADAADAKYNAISSLAESGGIKPGIESVFPNPGSGEVNISYTVSRTSEVMISVFDLKGRQVLQLQNGTQPPGSYQLEFDSVVLQNGLYLVRMVTDTGEYTAKIDLFN